jgi:hypothetical protein
MPKKQSKNKVRQNNQRKMSSRRGNSKNKKNRSKLSYRKKHAKGGSDGVDPPTSEFWKQLKNGDNPNKWIEHINGFVNPSEKSKHIKLFFGKYLKTALDDEKAGYTPKELEGILQTIEKIRALEGVSKDEELNTILDCARTKIKNVETTAKLAETKAKLAETEAELEKTKAELEKTKAPQKKSDWQLRKSGWR